MLSRIGVTRGAINHLLSDDLDTMEVLVTQYKDDIKDFHSYLKATNKNLTNVNPPVQSRILICFDGFWVGWNDEFTAKLS